MFRVIDPTIKAIAAWLCALLLTLFAYPALAGQAGLAWNPSPSANVSGYKVHYGTASASYSTHLDVGSVLTATVPNLNSGTTYYFAVTAYNAAGESGYSNEARATIPVAAPVASFNASAITGVAPLTTTFTSTSTGSISGYAWNFGDGTSATGASASKTYRTPGTYTVTLEVSGAGGSNSTSKNITISAAQLAADFSAPTTTGTAPLAVNFTATATSGLTWFAWDFGDGTTGSGASASHSYAAAGTYAVTLVASGSAGSKTVTKPGYIQVGNTLAAEFSASRTAGSVPMMVAFTDASTGTISSYAWNFGDGGTSTVKNPSHTYTSAGSYAVSLTVSGSGGTKSITKTGFIKVGMDNDLVVDFGATYGIWQWLNDSNWISLHGFTSRRIAMVDVDHNGQQDQLIDFGSRYGIWLRMNNANWVPLHSLSTNWSIKADVDDNGQDDLVVDFGAPYGIWAYLNGGSWRQLHGTTAKKAIAADIDHNGRDDIVVDFGATYGLWANMNGSPTTWKQLDARSPSWIVKADLDHNGQDDLVMSFGAGTGATQAYPGTGVWAHLNGATWRQVDYGTIASTRAIAVDIDHSGRDDLVIDYGSAGLWIYRNDTDWVKLHSLPSTSLAKADLDSNGQDDLVVDFGSRYGLYKFMNGTTWQPLHGVTTSTVAAGQVDGR